MDVDILHQLLEIFSGPSEAIGPGIAGLAAFFMLKYIKIAWAWVDSLNPWIQRIAVMGLAILFSWGGQLLGVVLPSELALWDVSTVSTLLTAFWAMLIHLFQKEISGGKDAG